MARPSWFDGPGLAPLERQDLLVAGAVAAGALLLYLTTVCRTLYWGDSAEFAVVFPRLDLAHPTGYPLTTILGKLTSLLPVGELAFRVNLLGTLSAVAACVFTYLLGRRLGVPAAAAAFGAAAFAVSLQLWDQATAVEVYALHVALTGAVLYPALGFAAAPSRGRFMATAALLGLAFTNHLTTLWTLPALVWLLLCGWRPWKAGTGWRPTGRDWAVAALVFTACVSLYLLLPLRSWQGVLFDHGQPSSVGRFLYHVTGRQFQYRMFVQPDTGLFKEVKDFAEQLSAQFTGWLLPFAAVGVLAMFVRDRRAAVTLGLLAGANLVFDLNYHIPDKEGYFLPVYLVVALWFGEGAAALAGLAGRTEGRKRAVLAASFLTLALPLVTNRPLVDKSLNRSLPEFTTELMGRLPAGALLFADDQFLVWSVAYAQLVEGKFRDRMLINDYLLCLPWYIAHLRRHYPELRLPREVDDLIARRDGEVSRAKGWEIGDISQRYTERIARSIIDANLPNHRVFYNFHDFEERKEWKGLPALNRGLVYELFAPGQPLPPPTPWAFDYPDPARYKKLEIKDSHWKHVADTYSTSCNRAGIACIGAGQHAEAEKAFLRAVAYNPEYSQVYLNLGVLYNQYLPDRAKRDAAWKRFLELAPDDAQAATVRRELEGSGLGAQGPGVQ